jgi:hypothetical protein
MDKQNKKIKKPKQFRLQQESKPINTNVFDSRITKKYSILHR